MLALAPLLRTDYHLPVLVVNINNMILGSFRVSLCFVLLVERIRLMYLYFHSAELYIKVL
jgi:hypothetical protein